MNNVATINSKIFHKTATHHPLLLHQLADLSDEFAAMAQMCQFLSLDHPHHDMTLTASLTNPHIPKTFEEWLPDNKYHNTFHSLLVF